MDNNNRLLGEALAALADCCAAVSGNMHTAHLNFEGLEFDTFHKKVLKKYYEELDNDYDELAEWSRCYDYVVQNKNESAARIAFKSLNGICNRESAIKAINENLNSLLEQFWEVYNAVNKITDCVIAIGVANWLQDRIQYWAKEVFYFNAKRFT